MRIALSSAACSLAFLLLVGCGSDADGPSSGTPDAGGDAGAQDSSTPIQGDDAAADTAPPVVDAGFVTAPHQPMPQLSKHTGSTLKSPFLVSISYAGYKYQGQVDDFGTFMVTSNWLTAVGKEYGIGPGTAQAVQFTGTPATALKDDDIQKIILDAVTDGTLPPTTATSTPIYMLYLPGTTTVDDGTGSTSCGQTGFLGYHFAVTQSNVEYVYAVIPDCGGGLADVTSTASHELLEALTDPYNPPKDGYYLDLSDANDPWNAASGDEISDMCDFELTTTEGSWTFERGYSNAAAKAGTSPCVPVPADDVYFNVSASPNKIQTVAPGKSATFTITGWSDAAIADWAIDWYPSDSSDFAVDVALSAKSINNGKTVTVTVTAPADAPSGALGGAFIVSGDNYHLWPVAIQTP